MDLIGFWTHLFLVLGQAQYESFRSFNIERIGRQNRFEATMASNKRFHRNRQSIPIELEDRHTNRFEATMVSNEQRHRPGTELRSEPTRIAEDHRHRLTSTATNRVINGYTLTTITGSPSLNQLHESALNSFINAQRSPIYM